MENDQKNNIFHSRSTQILEGNDVWEHSARVATYNRNAVSVGEEWLGSIIHTDVVENTQHNHVVVLILCKHRAKALYTDPSACH